jgi:flagellar basal-body rod protein FlgG
MVRFANPQGLLAQGGNLYRATEASGEAIGSRPGEDGVGTLAQGFLEGSNVKLVEEMVDLMVAQRAYEASVKVVQASDEMLGMINGLRR